MELMRKSLMSFYEVYVYKYTVLGGRVLKSTTVYSDSQLVPCFQFHLLYYFFVEYEPFFESRSSLGFYWVGQVSPLL